MKKSLKILSLGLYVITAIIYFVTIVISYGEVSRNLDGGHGFKSGHAMIFAVLCLLLIICCLYIMMSLIKDKGKIGSYVIGILLVILPLIFNLYAGSLQGNVKTDMEYLLLRTFQGFDYTYLYLIISSAIGYVFLLCNKIKQ